MLWENAARYDAGWGIPLLLLRRLPTIGAEWVGEGVSRLAKDSAYGLSEETAAWGVGVNWSGSGKGGVWDGGMDRGWAKQAGKSIDVNSCPPIKDQL
jgi:hypothetical protein